MIRRRFPFDVDLGAGDAPAFLPFLVAVVGAVALAVTLDLGEWAIAILVMLSALIVVAFLSWDWLRRMALEFPAGRLGRFLRHARRHARRGRFERALKCCERAAELAPRSARVHEERALVYLRQGRYEKGVEEFAAARAEDGAHFRLHTLLALTRARLGDFEGAAADYREAVARDPGDWTACHGLGFALWRQGKGEEAVSALRAGLERCAWRDVLVPAAMVFLTRLGKAKDATELGRARVPEMRRRLWWRVATAHLLGEATEAELVRWETWTREPAWRVAIWFYLAEGARARGHAERAREYLDRCVREGKAHESRGLASLVPEWGMALAESAGGH